MWPKLSITGTWIGKGGQDKKGLGYSIIKTSKAGNAIYFEDVQITLPHNSIICVILDTILTRTKSILLTNVLNIS